MSFSPVDIMVQYITLCCYQYFTHIMIYQYLVKLVHLRADLIARFPVQLFLASCNLIYVACPNVASTMQDAWLGQNWRLLLKSITCDAGFFVQLFLASCNLLYVACPNVASTWWGAWLGQISLQDFLYNSF